jgi:hypothetical protein
MEDVLEGSQRVHSRLIEVTRVEPEIGLASDEFRHTRSELIGETVKFIAQRNKLSLSSFASGFLSQIYPRMGYNLKIIVGKDRYELDNYPIEVEYHWEMAKSFESDPEAPGKFILKIDPISKSVTRSWEGSVNGEKWRFSLEGASPSLSFFSPGGHFISGFISDWIDITFGHGQSRKSEFLEGMFSEMSYSNAYRISQKFIRDVALAYLLAYGIIGVPYAVPVPVPINMALISSYYLNHSSANLQEE